jgi:hypothetical protein
MQAYMYSLCHALDVQISLSPTVSVRVTAAAAATIAAPVTLRSEKRVRMCVNTLRRTKSWKRMLTQSGTQQRCARPRGVCRPKQQCNKPSATVAHLCSCGLAVLSWCCCCIQYGVVDLCLVRQQKRTYSRLLSTRTATLVPTLFYLGSVSRSRRLPSHLCPPNKVMTLLHHSSNHNLKPWTLLSCVSLVTMIPSGL